MRHCTSTRAFDCRLELLIMSKGRCFVIQPFDQGKYESLFYLDLCTGSLIIVLLTTWFLVTPGAPHCRRWHEASAGATGARYAGTPTRLADKADVWTPPPAGEPVYSDVYLQVL